VNAPDKMKPPPGLSDSLAAERTFLAWIRTGLALMGFGFVVARFGLFLQRLQLIEPVSTPKPVGLSVWFGTALIAVGVLVLLLSAWRHVRLMHLLNGGGTAAFRPFNASGPHRGFSRAGRYC